MGLGLIIYAVYDVINDLLVGYLVDRPFKFTKKWGRRFPWMIVSFIPMLFSFLLIFSPPNVDAQEQPWILFGWLIFTTCLFDTIESFFSINFYSMFPYKFRTTEERLTSGSLSVYISMIGIVFGSIIPPMIVIFGNINSYVLMAWLTVILCLIPFPLFIPGIREEKEIIDNYIENYKKEEKESIFLALREVLTQRSFLFYMIFVFTYHVLNNTITASLFYYVNFVLGEPEDIVTIISIMLLLGSLVAVPLWYRYSRKTQNKKRTILLAGMVMIIFGFTMSFVFNLISFMIVAFAYGMGLGGFISIMDPVLSDCIDESIITHKKRREGFFHSINFFESNLSRVLQAIILTVTHELTGFIEGSATQPSSALFGIHLHIGIIPAIIFLGGSLIFWKFYDITPERSREIKEKLVDLGI